MDFDSSLIACSIKNPFAILCDDALVIAAQEGENGAFGELWTRHSTKTFRLLIRITKNREDAEDALQETFLKAFAHIGSFASRAKFSTWLTRIAVNFALMVLRKKRSRPTVSIEGQFDGETWRQWDVEDKTLDIERTYMKNECEAYLASAMSRLGPTLSVVIRHQLKHDSSIAEIAESAGLSVAATKSRLVRARSALRQSLYWYK